MSAAVVVSVTPGWQGSALTADVDATSTVLVVDNAGDFDETFETRRWLVLGEEFTPREYVAVTNDDDAPQQTVTLAQPAGVLLEAGLPVILWDPTTESIDKRAVEYVAMVRNDPDDDTVPATIPHEKIPLAGVYSLVGAQVTLAYADDDELEIDNIVGGRVPVFDGDYIATPTATGILTTDRPWPPGDFFTVKAWTAIDLVDITYKASTGIFTVQRDGKYLIVFGASFAPNGVNARAVRVRFHFADGTTEASRPNKVGAVDGITAIEVTQSRRLAAGEGVSFEVYQTSGADLTLLGSNIPEGGSTPDGGSQWAANTRARPTEVTIDEIAR